MICYLYAQIVDVFTTKESDTYFWHEYAEDNFEEIEDEHLVLVYEE